MTERRITVDAQGNKIGGGCIGSIINHSTFKGDDGMAKHMIISSWPDQKSPSILDGIKGQFPMQTASSPTSVASTIFPSSNVPLTPIQRLTELKKKIGEYKSLIGIINDATAKSFINLLLSNIEKEVTEIQAELGKTQYGKETNVDRVQTGPTQFPFQPVPYKPNQFPELWPNVGPGVPYQPLPNIGDHLPRVGDFPGQGIRWDAVADNAEPRFSADGKVLTPGVDYVTTLGGVVMTDVTNLTQNSKD